MEKQILIFGFALDDSFVSVIPQGHVEEIPGNELIFDEESTPGEALCLGEFRFVRSNDSHPWVRLSLRKRIRIDVEVGGRRQSVTSEYSYNLWLSDFDGNSLSRATPIIRFDNDHPYPKFSTMHHLHIQVDSKISRLKKRSLPGHVDESYPYLSDIFSIASALSSAQEGPVKIHTELLTKFLGISDRKKEDPVQWVPRLETDLFDFILP